MDERIPTAPPRSDTRPSPRARMARRFGALALGALVLAGATGRLGVTTSTVVAREGAVTLRVHHPAVARGGLAVTWSAEVSVPPSVETFTLETTTDYLAMFDINIVEPEPAVRTGDASAVRWTFTPIDRRLAVRIDARIEPGVQWGGRAATTTLLIDGRAVTSVGYSTTVLP